MIMINTRVVAANGKGGFYSYTTTTVRLSRKLRNVVGEVQF